MAKKSKLMQAEWKRLQMMLQPTDRDARAVALAEFHEGNEGIDTEDADEMMHCIETFNATREMRGQPTVNAYGFAKAYRQYIS